MLLQPIVFAKFVTQTTTSMRILSTLTVVLLLFACNQTTEQPITATSSQPVETPTRPKNIILMIGDGMGVTQITGGLYANGNKLNLERFKKIGFIKTYSCDDLITDSAAGATAFSCGVKTYNNAVGVDCDTIPQETILETLKKKGYATGVVSTSSVTHATPASFYAHQKKRKQMENNVADLFVTQPDLFMGGGKNFFEQRQDGRNITNELRDAGYEVVYNVADVTGNNNKVGVLIADEEPESFTNGRGEYLVPAAEKSIQILSQDEDGFFVMIEGSQIDWGGHANETEYIKSEMVDFDNAIGKVLDFAEKDGNTLVIITADHETGGFAITEGDVNDKSNFTGSFNTGHHTGTLIPVFAFGPGADEFTGIYENTGIYHKMMQVLGISK